MLMLLLVNLSSNFSSISSELKQVDILLTIVNVKLLVDVG